MSATGAGSEALPAGQAIALAGAAAYAPHAVVSTTLADTPGGTLTLFAFDAGQGLSEHTAPFDAIVLIVDGAAEVVIAGTPATVPAGELIRMPANVPHAVRANKRFKMLLMMFRPRG